MRKLLHLANKPDLLNQAQLDAYVAGGFTGAKLMPEHTPDHVAQLEELTPGGMYVGRLESSKRADGTWPSFQTLGNNWARQILRFEPLGVYIYQADTEPNNQAPVADAFTWQWLVGGAIRFMRQQLAYEWAQQGYSKAVIAFKQRRVQIYLAPLADGPGHWAEIEQPKGWWEACQELLRQPGLIQGIGVDSYWQFAQYALQDGFGANCAKYHRWAPAYPIIVAEWGCSLIDTYSDQEKKQPSPATLAAIEKEMLADYSGWLRWVQTQAPYVIATALFIAPGSDGWRGFEPSPTVLAAIHPY